MNPSHTPSGSVHWSEPELVLSVRRAPLRAGLSSPRVMPALTNAIFAATGKRIRKTSIGDQGAAKGMGTFCCIRIMKERNATKDISAGRRRFLTSTARISAASLPGLIALSTSGHAISATPGVELHRRLGAQLGARFSFRESYFQAAAGIAKFARAHVANFVGCRPATLLASVIASRESAPR